MGSAIFGVFDRQALVENKQQQQAAAERWCRARLKAAADVERRLTWWTPPRVKFRHEHARQATGSVRGAKPPFNHLLYCTPQERHAWQLEGQSSTSRTLGYESQHGCYMIVN